jgi:hypothetical protein
MIGRSYSNHLFTLETEKRLLETQSRNIQQRLDQLDSLIAEEQREETQRLIRSIMDMALPMTVARERDYLAAEHRPSARELLTEYMAIEPSGARAIRTWAAMGRLGY